MLRGWGVKSSQGGLAHTTALCTVLLVGWRFTKNTLGSVQTLVQYKYSLLCSPEGCGLVPCHSMIIYAANFLYIIFFKYFIRKHQTQLTFHILYRPKYIYSFIYVYVYIKKDIT